MVALVEAVLVVEIAVVTVIVIPLGWFSARIYLKIKNVNSLVLTAKLRLLYLCLQFEHYQGHLNRSREHYLKGEKNRSRSGNL